MSCSVSDLDSVSRCSFLAISKISVLLFNAEIRDNQTRMNLQSVQITGNWCHGTAYGGRIINEVDLRGRRGSSHLFNHTCLIGDITWLVILFSDSTSITCRISKQSDLLYFASLMQKPAPISKKRQRQLHVKPACLHNLPRRLFLTVRMPSQSASLPTALWSSARVVLQPYHSCRRAPRLQNPAE